MEYNGYKNYETWNVALWIGNDEGLYYIARHCTDYNQFVKKLAGVLDEPTHTIKTSDGVLWDDPELDIDELDELISEL